MNKPEPKFSRILLKLSGEALMGKREHGTDAADVRWVPVDALERYRVTSTAIAVIRKARA